MPTNETRRDLLNQIRSSGYPGSITEVFQASDQGIDLISQFQAEQDQQQQQMQVAQTPQQQEVGLREEHARGNTQASMAFPDVQPNQSFNTVGMEAPIDIQKVNDQGHLVESYKNVPPGIQDLPTGPYEGTIIESPAAYQKGGVKKNARERGMNTLGIEHLGHMHDWWDKHQHKDNFGYNNLEDFKKDWPSANTGGMGIWDTYEGGPSYDQNLEITKLKPKKIRPLPITEKEFILNKAGSIPEMKSLKDKVKDVSLNTYNYAGEDDAGVMDKHGRYFTLTLEDDSTMRLAPSTYRNYFGTESLTTPGKKLKVFKKEGGFAKYQKGGYIQKYPHGGSHDYIPAEASSTSVYMPPNNLQIEEPEVEDESWPTYASWDEGAKANPTSEMWEGKPNPYKAEMKSLINLQNVTAAASLPYAIPMALRAGSVPLINKMAGTSALDALGYYGGYHGITHGPEDLNAFIADPSLETGFNLGMDALGVVGGAYSTSRLAKSLLGKTKGSGTLPILKDLNPTPAEIEKNIAKYYKPEGTYKPSGAENFRINEIKKANIKYIKSEEYITKRMANTGESRKSILAQIDEYIATAARTKIEFKSPTLMGNASGKYTPGTSVLNPSATISVKNPIPMHSKKVAGYGYRPKMDMSNYNTIEHEYGHLFSPALKIDKTTKAYKEALKYEKAVEKVNQELYTTKTTSEAGKVIEKYNLIKEPTSKVNLKKASEKIYKNYPKLKIPEVKYKPGLGNEDWRHANYLNDPAEQQVRLVKINKYFKDNYNWDGSSANLTDNMLDKFLRTVAGRDKSVDAVTFKTRIPSDVRDLLRNVDVSKTSLTQQLKKVMPKAWALSAPVGIGVLSQTDTKQKGGFNIGAEISPEIGLGKFCGSLTGCGKGASPFSIRPSVEASYNTGSKNINTGYGGGIGAYIGSSGLESSLFYKRRNAFDTQGDDAVIPVGKGTDNLSLDLGIEGGGKGMRSVSDSTPYRYGINTEYDLTNKKLSNIGLYGQYGKFKGSLGYNPRTRGVNLGAGFKFQKGGRRLYKKGGPEIPEAPVVTPVRAPVTVTPAELFQYLTNVKGLSENHALGMINNIQHESGFEFGAHNPDDLGKPSSGLFQHRGSRRDSLVEFAGGEDEWSKDWRTQIDYMMTENDTKKYLKKAFNTPDEASSWFTEFWERPDKAKQKAKDRLTTLPNIINSVSKPIVYPNLLEEVTITPETQSEVQQEKFNESMQKLRNTFPIESAPAVSTQVNMPSPLITQQRKGGYKTGDINEFATRYPKKKEMINTPFLENIQEFGDNISTIFKPKTYKKGHLTLRGKLNEPKINIGWNPNLRTTPFGGPTFSKPSYSGNISADLRLRKNLSLYGNVNYRSEARPEYRTGLRFRFKRGGYKSKVCW